MELISRNFQPVEKINECTFLRVDRGLFTGHFDEPRLTVFIQDRGKDALLPSLLIDQSVTDQVNHQVIVSVRLDSLGRFGEGVLIDRWELHLATPAINIREVASRRRWK